MRDISVYFNCWCAASDIKTLAELKELLVLDQFKNSISNGVATYISERNPTTAYDAAVMPDEFFLIHKNSVAVKTVEETIGKYICVNKPLKM